MQADATLIHSLAGRRLRLAGALAGALALAGCAGGSGASGGAAPSATSRLAGLLSFGSPAPAATPAAPNAPQLRSCPEVTIVDGGAALRVGGPASQSVRHQFAITDVARECQLQGAVIAIKVGVEGNLLIGPAGSAGSYSAGVRVAVRAMKDQRVLSTRNYRVSATADNLQAAPFTLVTESFTVPYIQEYASDDYEIIVAFEGSKPADSGVRRVRRR